MIKLAKILQIDQARVILRLEQNSECSDCQSRCSDGFLSFLFNKYKNINLIVNRDGDNKQNSHLVDRNTFFNDKHQVDDVIGINFNESNMLRLSIALYGLPMLFIVISLVCVYGLFTYFSLNPDVGGLLGLIIGLYISVTIVKYNQTKLKPEVVFFK